MKWTRMLWAVVSLIGVLAVVFLAANWWVGGGSSENLIDLARAKCVKDGFPIEHRTVSSFECVNHLFGGRATVEFCRVGMGPWGPDEPRVFRVELRKRMNLLGWEAVSVSQEP
jgi:hypothetical protein